MSDELSSRELERFARRYLEMRRFMEAMVIAKKGITAHPTSVDLRLLLVEVFAVQGNELAARRALEAALRELPNSPRLLERAKAMLTHQSPTRATSACTDDK